jgi:hypothetical protein
LLVAAPADGARFSLVLSRVITNGDLIQGITAAAELGRVVINISVGSTRFDALLADTVAGAVRRGA